MIIIICKRKVHIKSIEIIPVRSDPIRTASFSFL